MANLLAKIHTHACDVILGKENELKQSIICLVSGGHLLIEDVPGVGKTTMVYLLSKLLGRSVTRIQFTNDLLPADILGSMVFDRDKNEFSFRKGPIFGDLVLADELNRASPKTQSALLQAMEEKRISIDGTEYQLNESFNVVATQNPFEQLGTYELPESQLDRFFMGVSLGYPSRDYEKMIIQTSDIRERIDRIDSIATKAEIRSFLSKTSEVLVSDEILDYVLDILTTIRRSESRVSVSPRSGKNLIMASKVLALFENRDYVLPDDIKYLAPSILGHRLSGEKGVIFGQELVAEIVSKISVR